MNSILNTALMGFLLYSGAATGTPATWATVDSVSEPTYVSYSVHMTGYNAVPGQTDSNPLITASGAFSNPEIVAARSVDLVDELPFGTVIQVDMDNGTSTPDCGLSMLDDVGLRVIADSMHPRKRNQIDLLFDTDKTVKVGGKDLNQAITLGVCKQVKIKVVGHIDINHMPKTQDELKTQLNKQVLALRK